MSVNLCHCADTPLDDANDLHFSKVRAIYPGMDNNVVGTTNVIDPTWINEEYSSREIPLPEHVLILVDLHRLQKWNDIGNKHFIFPFKENNMIVDLLMKGLGNLWKMNTLKMEEWGNLVFKSGWILP